MYLTQKTTPNVVFCQTFTLTVSGVEAEKRFVTLRLTAKGMRIIDKRGIDSVLAEVRARGENV
jgi:ribosomal protein L28